MTASSLMAALDLVMSDARVARDPGLKPIESNMHGSVRDYVQMPDPPTFVLSSGRDEGLVAVQFHAPHAAFEGERAAQQYHLHAKKMKAVDVDPSWDAVEYRRRNLVFVNNKWYHIERTEAASGTRAHYFIPDTPSDLGQAQVGEVVRRFLLEHFGKRDVVADPPAEAALRAQLPFPLQ